MCTHELKLQYGDSIGYGGENSHLVDSEVLQQSLRELYKKAQTKSPQF